MKNWNNIHEMAGELGLRANTEDKAAVVLELRNARADLHPDRNGGDFKNEAERDRYHRVSEALEFAEAQQSTALITRDDLALIVATVQKAMSVVPADRPTDIRSEYKALAGQSVQRRFFFPRVGSGVFAAICAAIVAFSNGLSENPVFRPILEIPYAPHAIAILALYAGLFFVFTWVREQREMQHAEWLTTESALRRALAGMLFRADEQQDGSVIFSSKHLVVALLELSHGGRVPGKRRAFDALLWPLRKGINASAAEKLAKAHIEELAQRGVAEKVPGGLDSRYRIGNEAVKDLKNSFGEDEYV